MQHTTKKVSLDDDDVSSGIGKGCHPFEETIDALKEISKIESPMIKLEYIYQVFN